MWSLRCRVWDGPGPGLRAALALNTHRLFRGVPCLVDGVVGVKTQEPSGPEGCRRDAVRPLAEGPSVGSEEGSLYPG